MKRITALILALTMVFSLIGCAGSNTARQKSDLMAGISAQNVRAPSNIESGTQAVTAFGVKLAQNSFESDHNLLISPLSIFYALAMTANGAKEETLRQMESALGLSIEELNSYLHWYVTALPQGDSYRLSLANSI